MSVHYFAMVRHEPGCSVCDGDGQYIDWEGDGQPCEDCNGTGRLPERLVIHRDGKLYDEPGKASGSAKRAGFEPVVYKVDTDECEPVDRHMSIDEKIGHAEAKYIFWGGRLEELQQRAAGRPTPHRHNPKLTAEDYKTLREVLGIVIDDHPYTSLADRAQPLLDRVIAKVHLDQMDAEAVQARAETDRLTAEWAAGKGSRKCLRVGEINAFDGTARTACGSTVPGPASTTNRDEVACCGCEGKP